MSESVYRGATSLPPEVWSRVFHLLPPKSLHVLLNTDPYFHPLVIPFIRSAVNWSCYFDFISDYLQFWVAQYPGCTSAVRSATIGRIGRSRRLWQEEMAWDFGVALPILSTFSNIRVLSLLNVRYPAHDLPSHFASLPNLREAHFMFYNGLCSDATAESISFPVLRSILPPLDYLEVRGLSPIQSTERRGCSIHAGLAAMAVLSCLPSLRILDVDLDSWDSLAAGRASLLPPTSLPAGLQQVSLFRDAPKDATAPVYSKDWGDNFLVELSTTTLSLLRLHVVLGVQVLLSAAASTLVLPSLVEFIGPHHFLPFLAFPHTLQTLWVTTLNIDTPSEWSLSSAFPSSSIPLSLQSFALLEWEPFGTSFSDILSLSPDVSEISLSLAGSSCLSEEDLLGYGSVLARSSITHLTLLGCDLSGSMMERIVLGWKESQPLLVEVRLSASLCWSWGGGRLTTSRLDRVQPSVPTKYDVVYRLNSRHSL
ncbi:hypothetical protein V5O48_005248 [Marasmius crinis-equi]|uniref:F-box domain-containing protein n=1 Tax=Marasmius crinis-equi TaxID=585013 RepID=A0ABR3FMS1_9AGAR